MPYNNNYNQDIAKKYINLNKRYIDNERKNNQLFHHNLEYTQFGNANKNLEGGAVPTDLNDDVKYGVNQGVRAVYGDASQYGSNEGEKNNVKGGSGFAEGTHMDTGFTKTLGAGKTGKGSKVFKNESLKLVRKEGGKKRGRPSKKHLEGEGFFDSVLSGLKSVASVAKPILKMIPDKRAQMAGNVLDAVGAGKKRGRPSKKMTGGTELGLPKKSSLEGAGLMSENVKRVVGGGKKRGRPAKKHLEGEGFFDDVWSGIKTVASPVLKIAKPLLKMVPDPRAQMAGNLLDAVGAGKKRGRPSKMKGGRELVPVANMKASSMAGQGKPKKTGGNKRNELVKKIMKEQGLSMIKASSYVKDHELYKP